MKGFLICCKAKDIGMKITDHFKNNLNEHLNSNTLLNSTSIKLSQELDMLVVREQMKKVNSHGCTM